MRELIRKFAKIVMDKLARLVTEYTVVKRGPHDETWSEGTSRAALLWLLEWVTARFDRFPWINPMTRKYVQHEFEKIVEYLRSDWTRDLNGDFA